MLLSRELRFTFSVCRRLIQMSRSNATNSRVHLFQALTNYAPHQHSSRHQYFKSSSLLYHDKGFNSNANGNDLDGESADEWTDFDISEMSEDYMLPAGGHRVFVVQPDIRWGPLKPKLTTTELKLEEACALVESIPQWSVQDKLTFVQKEPHKDKIAGPQTMERLSELMAKSSASAVFLSVNMLSANQLMLLQKQWKLPVYDRYTIVLQIFQTRARTKAAKIQVALAQIPYLRSRLPGMHAGTLDQQSGGLATVGGSGETLLETRQRMLRKKEVKLLKALEALKGQREQTRKQRNKQEFPIVAVVGYTNAGKTSLIKALSREAEMQPRDQLFATLDVTVHAATLPNYLTVLLVDTVGFISDIPTSLVQAFRVTMEDVMQADIIVHIRDRSHPDQIAQRDNVLQTLAALGLSQERIDNVIEVCNKMDKVTEDLAEDEKDTIQISATQGSGLQELRAVLQDRVMEVTGRLHKHVRIPQNGQHLSWLYKEATVEATHPCPEDPEALIVEVIFTKATWGKFQAYFGGNDKQRKKRKY